MGLTMDKEEIILFQTESSAARQERTIARLIAIVALLIILLVGTNGAWLYYEKQFEDISTTIEADQESDNGGTNYIVNGDYGTSAR